MNSPAQRTVTPLAGYLAERIRAQGPITFAEFMRESLYHPKWGYYLRDENERLADFYTSVDLHPIFGRLIARQLDEMWRLLQVPYNLPGATNECRNAPPREEYTDHHQ